MKQTLVLVCIFGVLSNASGQRVRPELLSTAWIELGENGHALARVVVNEAGGCPSVRVDRQDRAMNMRQPVPQGLQPVCELAIPDGTRSASLDGHALAIPRPNPTRIVAFGDSGCRVSQERVQDCNDPDQWPLERVSRRAAAQKPDLVIHVGDYLYREAPCPPDKASFCGGTPRGDSWDAWNADFFNPAARLLAAAPWALARGNHETCQRSWRGWFYYLDPRPWTGTCDSYSPPYLVTLGRFQVLMLDSSAATDATNPQQTAKYAGQLSSIHVTGAWLVDHHPFWLPTSANGSDVPVPATVPLRDAWEQAAPAGIDLVLSGHVHLFQVLSFDHTRPPQIVAGTGGALLSPTIRGSINGIAISGATITASQTRQAFGYSLFTRAPGGWNLSLRSGTGTDETVVACQIRGRQASCGPAPPTQ